MSLFRRKSSTDKHLCERYAQASTVDAARARESILPTLEQNNGDGTTWIRSITHAIPMVRSIRDISPRGWTFAHDRFAVTDLSMSMAQDENPRKHQNAAARKFWEWKTEMQRKGHRGEPLPWMRKELKDRIASQEPRSLSEDNHADPVLLHGYGLGGTAFCEVRTPNPLSSNFHPSPDVRVSL
jgi:hypothetical protein